MRRRKNEEIRKLVSAAAAMCDLSALSGVRRKLAEATRELEELDRQRPRKTAEPYKSSFKVNDPEAALRAIEMEMDLQREKISDKQADRVIND